MRNEWVLALLGAGLLAAFLLGGFHRRRLRRCLDAFLVGRAPLEPEELASFFTPGAQAMVAVKLRTLLAQYLVFDPGKVRPDDRLVADLRMDALDSLATNEFVLDIERELGVAIPGRVAEHLSTFREVVEYVSANLPASPLREKS